MGQISSNCTALRKLFKDLIYERKIPTLPKGMNWRQVMIKRGYYTADKGGE